MSTNDEFSALFHIDGEPCGPRTELWSGYLEENNEISFVSTFNLWIRCSEKNWGNENLVVILYKKVGSSPWANYQSMYHCFAEDLRICPQETKNVCYVLEIANTNGMAIARSPIMRPYTERWYHIARLIVGSEKN